MRKMTTPERQVWTQMRQRCLNPNNKDFAAYGGRGITVCKRWATFANFMVDMGERPSPKHQLDRENNSKGYSKANCRWVLRLTNARNKRSCVYVTLQGRRVPLSEAAQITGVNYFTLAKRKARGLTARTGLYALNNLQTGKTF